MTTLAELRLAWQASGLHLSDEFLAGMLAYIQRLERGEHELPAYEGVEARTGTAAEQDGKPTR